MWQGETPTFAENSGREGEERPDWNENDSEKAAPFQDPAQSFLHRLVRIHALLHICMGHQRPELKHRVPSTESDGGEANTSSVHEA